MIMISIADIEKNKQHSHAHNLLRECLKAYNINYNEKTAVLRGKHGKPYLADYPDIHFNLSHSAGIAACIVSGEPCGIDCERVGEYRPGVVKRAFSDSEKAMLEAAGEMERDILFFRLWTLKEAFVKAIGVGVSYPMDTAVFRFDGGDIICSEKGYSFRQYILRGGKYVVSVCQGENGSHQLADKI